MSVLLLIVILLLIASVWSAYMDKGRPGPLVFTLWAIAVWLMFGPIMKVLG